MNRLWKLSPSDFAFTWEECRRCFYLKVVLSIQRPSLMPKIFNRIDKGMRMGMDGVRTETIAPSMPPGVIVHGEQWVQSNPIIIPGHRSRCFIRGRVDAVLRLDNGTWGIVDRKTAETKDEHIPLYGRQLHAYTYSLENPISSAFAANPVTRLGLLVFEPMAFTYHLGGGRLEGGLQWVEVPRNDAAFFAFLDEVLTVLDSTSPPEASPTCASCLWAVRSMSA